MCMKFVCVIMYISFTLREKKDRTERIELNGIYSNCDTQNNCTRIGNRVLCLKSFHVPRSIYEMHWCLYINKVSHLNNDKHSIWNYFRHYTHLTAQKKNRVLAYIYTIESHNKLCSYLLAIYSKCIRFGFCTVSWTSNFCMKLIKEKHFDLYMFLLLKSTYFL